MSAEFILNSMSENMKLMFRNDYTFNPIYITKMTQLVNGLFERYSKMMVIRFDGYIDAEYQDYVNPYYLRQRWTQFRNNARDNCLFKHMVGFITKIEYGEQRGWHMHVAIFFDAHYVQKDGYLAKKLCDYWNGVLNREIGQSYTSNLNKEKFVYDALGIIDYYDLDKQQQLITALSYLCKEDTDEVIEACQHVDAKPIQSFSTSRLPKMKRGGRPRLYAVS